MSVRVSSVSCPAQMVALWRANTQSKGVLQTVYKINSSRLIPMGNIPDEVWYEGRRIDFLGKLSDCQLLTKGSMSTLTSLKVMTNSVHRVRMLNPTIKIIQFNLVPSVDELRGQFMKEHSDKTISTWHNKEKHEDNKKYGSCIVLTELASNSILFLWEGFIVKSKKEHKIMVKIPES
jgi:hypothetical protein